MRIKDELPQFLDDFIISWDSSDKGDATCVSVVKLKKDGTHVTGEVVGLSYEKSGCISLRQALEVYEERKRLEAEHAERLRRTFTEKGGSADV